MRRLTFSTGLKKPRTAPDKRITVTSSIVMIEYPDGRDYVIKRGDIRAENIVKQIALT